MGVSEQGAAAALKAALTAHLETVGAMQGMSAEIARAADLIASSVGAGGQLLVCGNGGSAADAQHIAAELVGRFQKDRDPWPAIAVGTNTSTLTSIGNDYGFGEVFARQVRAHGREGDVLLAISTSGTSENVVAAIGAARSKGMFVIGLTGTSPAMASLCDVCLRVPSDSTPRIQEAHILIAHVLCGLVEDALS